MTMRWPFSSNELQDNISDCPVSREPTVRALFVGRYCSLGCYMTGKYFRVIKPYHIRVNLDVILYDACYEL